MVDAGCCAILVSQFVSLDRVVDDADVAAEAAGALWMRRVCAIVAAVYYWPMTTTTMTIGFGWTPAHTGICAIASRSECRIETWLICMYVDARMHIHIKSIA